MRPLTIEFKSTNMDKGSSITDVSMAMNLLAKLQSEVTSNLSDASKAHSMNEGKLPYIYY